ncbi:FadR/GntR family transcriptional regulator [Aureimonas altamirensis]|uniref:FadR/GntR family transcriptional regulator n=1 Tax=Aureimonas altamirensis TaxID=370622 RepID=UPI0030180379
MGAAGHTLQLSDLPIFREGIVRKPIREVIADKLSTLVASGILQVGDTLPGERDLALALNVSREAVRGAIQTLAARGILEVSHGARTRVLSADVGPVTVGLALARAIDAYDIDNVHAARILVEQKLVADVAHMANRRLCHTLRDLLQAQAGMLDDPVRFLICDREFHVAIYRAPGNRLLADFATDLYTYMMEYRRRAIGQPDAIGRSYAEHEAIVSAIEAGDANAAVSAFAVHTGRIYTTTRFVMEGQAPPITGSAPAGKDRRRRKA